MTDNEEHESPLTVFMLVRTTPEFLALTVEQRSEFGQRELQPILNNFAKTIRLKWFDTEFFSARITDILQFEIKTRRSYELFCEKLRETAFWDRYFRIEEILAGEENAWARNYGLDPLGASMSSPQLQG